MLLVASVAAVFIAASLPDTILAGDAVNYRERMIELFAGHVPYFEFDFEHQPLMLLPMAVAWLLGGSSSQPAYVIVFAGISFLALAGTTLVLSKIDRRWGSSGLASRFIVLVIPMLPLLLFRNDSFSILLSVMAAFLLISDKVGSGVIVTVWGVLSKIWTGVLSVVLWWKRRMLAAAIVVVAVAGAIAINFSPPVQAIQQGDGIHTETLAGSALGLYRIASGSPLEINRAATAFLDAPAWMLVINVMASVPILFLTLRRLQGSYDEISAWALVGALTSALLLASPFFSPQYVAWVFPFAAARARFIAIALGLSVASIAMALGWYSLFDGTLWWWALTLARNLGLLVLGIQMARQVARPAADSILA
jgi:hypothetical protein